jgi:16S rRNA (cytidine1402-2'-O)-methyltransferase
VNHKIEKLTAGLYFVATPLGSARDITLRALDILASADILVAEDTRSLRKLMDIHGVPLGDRRMYSYHDHSSDSAVLQMIEAIKGGQSVAYASEAGTPLIADPGFEIARAVGEAGLLVTSAPGPSAVITALTSAGLATDRFYFVGFLPNSQKQRQEAMLDLANVQATLVFYESPKRIAAMLADAAQTLGVDRAAAVCRELTKRFEEFRRGSLGELATHYAETKTKGEIVVLIDRARSQKINQDDITVALKEALDTMSVRDASEAVAGAYAMPKKQVYKMALDLKKADEA